MPGGVLIQRAVYGLDRGGENFRRTIEVRRALAEIYRVVLSRQIIDLDKNRRAKSGDALGHQ